MKNNNVTLPPKLVEWLQRHDTADLRIGVGTTKNGAPFYVASLWEGASCLVDAEGRDLQLAIEDLVSKAG